MRTYLSNLALLTLVVITFLSSGCLRPPDYPDEPVIEYVGMNTTIVPQGSLNAPSSELTITIGYTDGDGDVGALSRDTFTNNIIYIDNRDGVELTASVPFIPDLGSVNGISGTISFTLTNENRGICCTFEDKDGELPCTPSSRFTTDTLIYTIFVRDQAGNESNRIETEPIVILCN